MNRIYQGKVTDVEIHATHILSASNGERNEVRCRNRNAWQPFDPDSKQAKAIGYRSSVIGHSTKAHAHQLFQDAVN